jgi:hypothetical protein
MNKPLRIALIVLALLAPLTARAEGSVDHYESRLGMAEILKVRLGMDLEQAGKLYRLEHYHSGQARIKQSLYRILDDIPGTAKYKIVTNVEGPVVWRQGKLANEKTEEKVEAFKDRFVVTVDEATRRIVGITCHFSADRGKQASEEIRKYYLALLGTPHKAATFGGGEFREEHWVRDGFLIRVARSDDRPEYDVTLENAVTAIEIVGYGLYEEGPGEKQYVLKAGGTRIQAEIGVIFGISYRIRTFVPGVREQVEYSLKTPAMTNPKTGKTRESYSTFVYPTSGRVEQSLFRISERYEQVAGPFTFRLNKSSRQADWKAEAEKVLETVPPE